MALLAGTKIIGGVIIVFIIIFRRQYCHLLVSHCFLVALSHCLQHYFFYFFGGATNSNLRQAMPIKLPLKTPFPATRVEQRVESAQHTFSHFFRLLARISAISDKKYHILTCRAKRESCLIILQQNNVQVCSKCEAPVFFYWLSLCLSLALYGSL